MIKLTVDSVKYSRSAVELELREESPKDSSFHRVGVSCLNLRFTKEDPLYATVVEKATIGATMSLDFVAPQEEPQA